MFCLSFLKINATNDFLVSLIDIPSRAYMSKYSKLPSTYEAIFEVCLPGPGYFIQNVYF